MRTAGVELEFNDIKTYDAAKVVFKRSGRNIEDWQDRWGAWSKPELDYTHWNVMSDGSIHNSDGTRCMFTVVEDGELRQARSSKRSEDRKIWKGAELISPAFTVYQEEYLYKELEEILGEFKELGATVTRHGRAALHVHVDVTGSTLDDVKGWLPKLQSVQSLLKPLAIDISKSPRKKHPLYTDELIEDLNKAESVEEFLKRYFYTRGRVGHGGQYAVRRLVDVSPALDEKKPYNTIEFRCFTSSLDVEVTREAVGLSRNIVDSLVEKREIDLDFVEEKVRKLEELRYADIRG